MSMSSLDPNVTWTSFLAASETKISKHVLDTWLAPVRLVGLANGTATLEVRDQFFRDWLNDHYLDFIRAGLKEVTGEHLAVDWVMNPTHPAADSPGVDLSEEEAQVAPPAPVNTFVGSLPLNPRYDFDTFVAGRSNEFAFAACKAVADKPATAYNPLFLFGGTGLGKTHLLNAIGHQIVKEKPRTRILYTTSEQFVNEVINGVRFNKLDEFHNKYRRSCDVLLMDDIQLIAGKERTQYEFFHIFNTLYDSQRQIVVTSDKLPHEIPEIEERLRSRFQWGLIADIQPPEIETRVAILRKKADNEGIPLSDEVAFFLAKSIPSNVRELEGALIRLAAHASLTNTVITLDYAKQVLNDILDARGQQISIEAIQKLVAGYFQVRVADLKSARRQKVLVRPRQVAMYLCRKHAQASFPELGTRFGDKDHTTIMSACRRVETQLKEDPSLRKQVLDLERQLDVPAT
ncbi:MAG: chromosomal replication initiator protein DnaA [Deltaproteobacteria bacterium]|nr:chromosomal replication initiator protein DnaA [Deltaproteobacteria bacterium]